MINGNQTVEAYIHFFMLNNGVNKIADINAPQEYNVKMADQADVAVECIAEEARPPPKFTWFLGEDQLNVSID